MQSVDSRNLDGIPSLCRDRAAGRRVEGDGAVGTSEAGGGDEVVAKERDDESVWKDDGGRDVIELDVNGPNVGGVDDVVVTDADGSTTWARIVKEGDAVDEGVGRARVENKLVVSVGEKSRGEDGGDGLRLDDDVGGSGTTNGRLDGKGRRKDFVSVAVDVVERIERGNVGLRLAPLLPLVLSSRSDTALGGVVGVVLTPHVSLRPPRPVFRHNGLLLPLLPLRLLLDFHRLRLPTPAPPLLTSSAT
jgi:hypothetical protein